MDAHSANHFLAGYGNDGDGNVVDGVGVTREQSLFRAENLAAKEPRAGKLTSFGNLHLKVDLPVAGRERHVS